MGTFGFSSIFETIGLKPKLKKSFGKILFRQVFVMKDFETIVFKSFRFKKSFSVSKRKHVFFAFSKLNTQNGKRS